MTNPEVITQLTRLLSDNVLVGKERLAVEIAIAAVEKYGDYPVCGNHMDSPWTDEKHCSKCAHAIK
ncbi:MAG: hypothetical protein LUE86_07580 [Clostridiales bacterium]|nr:hypothetical protein [Clostridiales bacterium]